MGNSNQVYWQAHRGGGAYEAPDNTMVANNYAWGLGGIPEADIRTTSDGVIVCLHDETLARTTTAPDNVKDLSVSQLTFEEVRKWDAGIKFNEKFAGEKVPSLEQVFMEMKTRPERLIYLDLKNVDLQLLGALIDSYGVNKQVIFTHNVMENCQRMKEIAVGVRSMLWIGGEAERIKQKFIQVRDGGFEGLDQVQLHMKYLLDSPDWPYTIDKEFLSFSLEESRNAGIDLELFLFHIDDHSVKQMLDMGIRWYATDEPTVFLNSLHQNKYF